MHQFLMEQTDQRKPSIDIDFYLKHMGPISDLQGDDNMKATFESSPSQVLDESTKINEVEVVDEVAEVLAPGQSKTTDMIVTLAVAFGYVPIEAQLNHIYVLTML